MSFFKRLSRGSRSNSYSYADDGYDSPKSDRFENNNRDTRYEGARPDSSGRPNEQSQHNRQQDPSSPTGGESRDMYGSRSAPKDGYQDAHYSSPRGGSSGGGGYANGMSHSAMPTSAMDSNAAGGRGNNAVKSEPMPDLLQQAFQQAVLPYQQKIEEMEGQMQDIQAWVDQLEQERKEMHAWIDKRGLRPDVPPAIAKSMDTTPDAATTLNAQLDRKITIVNFDLHRLQDDLNDSISSSHFAAAMSKFLPDIQRLSHLPTGPRLAFDLILKLGGNLNSHGGLDSADAEDLRSRKEFYSLLDAAMVDVVRRRFQEGEEWPVAREIKRIEKTAAYLRNFGVEPYFPKTLDTMSREGVYRNGAGGSGGGGGSAQRAGGGGGGGAESGGGRGASSPPRYQ